ncbi:lantibiotic ABC transporter ATP-binding protein [Virgibacillus pantothenticus]|uniref:Lantibiotic ABC transporter ATP-binding protein n=2 Tax=Virgibacillus pantothenticus TaxID=1473 RepID=A0A0L0QLN2_VIRPA|nr:lantibiotic protection ABC transporter ATP-binding subunit [Virgibacillus pantothenticus]KNE19173.1 lantibiotic ABC transporter ATP-binding protein [Virgibacillus pantothenticus]MBU8568483.1 lantibiotic protection ABC transporter ATP-binding subunit [Virgibacillus pantothenticus]MBU8599915.1 lantibiotic protection ABC transporter ATP-binding subunit [Virgibacillus pantothenticus]MBU8636643.1 lantibiotic protection ABC transporter ATP-binding subunit [Virgibacillus pantothenticus]MBU8642209.
MSKYMLETRDIGKMFKDEKVLTNINMHVKYSEIYGLLGLNGAGKSTLMKIICGIFRPSVGEVMFAGHKWNRNDLHEIGSLIEGPAIYGNLTAYDNLKLFCLQEGIPLNEINPVLAKMKLENTGKKKVKNFSIGMKQRLGIAMALIKKPKLLVLDEPSNGLDPMGIQELRTLLTELKDNGITIMISSHILSEIQLVSDTIGIIHNGTLEYEKENNHEENLEKTFFDITVSQRGCIMT